MTFPLGMLRNASVVDDHGECPVQLRNALGAEAII